MPTAEPGATTRALLKVSRDVVDDRALAAEICRACIDGLGADGAALSLSTAGPAHHTLHATDETADLLEELQFGLSEGACVEAATTGLPVLVSDVHDPAEASRWPLFAAAVIEQTPVRALYALPLRWGPVNLGVLDLYRRTPGGLSTEQHRDALAAMDTAGLMMLTLRTDPAGRAGGVVGGAAHDENGTDSWLAPMVAGRAEVHQATGMVLLQLGITADAAFARLRAHAFAEQRALIDIADDVVTRRLVFTEEME